MGSRELLTLISSNYLLMSPSLYTVSVTWCLGLPGPRGKPGKPGTNGTPGIPGVKAYEVTVNGTKSSELLIPPSIIGK